MESNSSRAGMTSDVVQLQALMSISKQFYMHKSFDIQSDMEFLPELPQSRLGMSTRFRLDDELATSAVIKGEYFSNRPPLSQSRHLGGIQTAQRFNRNHSGSSPRSIPIMPNLHNPYKSNQSTANGAYSCTNAKSTIANSYKPSMQTRSSKK